jgi:hypothetical protein
MKYIAYYFPQFYRINENDKWWGDGFTDWDLVKKSLPNIAGQYQPRKPLNENFYDLSNPDTVNWQIDIASEYNLSGFNFYHYWFDGRLLLEKPISFFKNNKRHNLQYCITWANEAWTRQWIGNPEVLISQKYSYDKNVWMKHYNYLAEYFHDERYIKINNKPLYCIYRPDIDPCIKEYIDFFNDMAIKDGFSGIYFAGMLSYNTINLDKVISYFDAKIKFQPRYFFYANSLKKNNVVNIVEKAARTLPEKMQYILGYLRNKCISFSHFDYLYFWNKCISDAKNDGNSVFQSVIVDWDNTPRYGKRSKFFLGPSPEMFSIKLDELTKIEIEKGNDFIFINAWNEWSEGAYLEPDEKNGYGYLNALKNLAVKYAQYPVTK